MRSLGAWKKRIRIAVLALLAADALLFWFNWRVVGAPPEAQRDQMTRARRLHQQWRDDVARVSAIRGRLADTELECNRFFAEQFLSEAVGSSTVVEDLTAIASRAGLQARSVTYNTEDIPKRNVVEVSIAAGVEGSYSSILRFIRGLEQSERFYLMESLGLATAQGGDLRLNLQLKTYFRMDRGGAAPAGQTP